MKSLSTSDLSNVAAFSFDWIESVSARLTENDVPQLLKAYIITALCGDIEPALHNRATGLLRRLRIKINVNFEKEIALCDGTTILLCGLLDVNQRGEMLPAIENYAVNAASALNELPLFTVTENFCAAKTLLAGIGLSSALIPQTSVFAPELSSLLKGNEETTRNLVARVESLTYYGIYNIEFSAGLDAVIQCLMMEALRNYNFELANKLLRSLIYLEKSDNLAARTALHFVHTSQNAEGCFGFFDSAIRKMRLEGPEPYASLRIHLPVALSCLWMLAEAKLSNYRMLRDLGIRIKDM